MTRNYTPHCLEWHQYITQITITSILNRGCGQNKDLQGLVRIYNHVVLVLILQENTPHVASENHSTIKPLHLDYSHLIDDTWRYKHHPHDQTKSLSRPHRLCLWYPRPTCKIHRPSCTELWSETQRCKYTSFRLTFENTHTFCTA